MVVHKCIILRRCSVCLSFLDMLSLWRSFLFWRQKDQETFKKDNKFSMHETRDVVRVRLGLARLNIYAWDRVGELNKI